MFFSRMIKFLTEPLVKWIVFFSESTSGLGRSLDLHDEGNNFRYTRLSVPEYGLELVVIVHRVENPSFMIKSVHENLLADLE